MHSIPFVKFRRAIIGVAALCAGGSIGFVEAAEAPAGTPPPADSPGEVDLLRQEVAALKAELEAMRAKLDALAAAAPAAGPGAVAPPTSAAAPPEAPAAPPLAPPAAPPAQAAAPSRSPGLMNPAISAVFQLIGSGDTSTRENQDGFDLSEAEVAFESTVDPYAKMNLFLSFPAEDSPEVEEGTVTTLALPASLQLKGGRFKSSFGRWNSLHTHAFPTVERPLMLENYFGGESLTNDGLSLSWLVPTGGLYLDSTTEVGTARENPSFNSDERALTWSERLSALFNPTANATIEAGASYVAGRTGPGDSLLAAIDAAGLTGVVAPDTRSRSAVAGVDVTWKWKPLQYNTERSFTWQTEVLRAHRDQESLAGASLVDGSVASLGGYTYVEAQWRKRWRWGVRGDLSGYPDSDTARAWGVAGVVRFIPSEFQEIRFQVRRTRFNDEAAALQDGDNADTRVFFEWIPVIGAHGAHRY